MLVCAGGSTLEILKGDLLKWEAVAGSCGKMNSKALSSSNF